MKFKCFSTSFISNPAENVEDDPEPSLEFEDCLEDGLGVSGLDGGFELLRTNDTEQF